MRAARLPDGAGTDVPGATVYTRTMLRVYDVMVLGLTLRWFWRCPSRHLLEFYDRHVGASHLDAGVGTGYFLDKCRFPAARPALTLLDVNPNCLQRAAQRLRRYAPESVLADLRLPLPPGLGPFDSIAVSMLLHCVPGSMAGKAGMLGRLRPLLRPGGRLFGTTLLGAGISMGLPSRLLTRAYNAKGILCNLEDDLPALEAAMARHFTEVSVHTRGSLAFFVGRA